MIPILFAPDTTDFTTNGLGRLSDATACNVHEVLNGEFELEMQYSITGALYSQIVHSAIICAAPGDGRDPQPFRIYKITKPMGGVITINAEHISYQLSSIPVSPFTATGVVEAFEGLKSHAAGDCPFAFWTDKTTAGTFAVTAPASIRSRLGGSEGSIIDTYKGEYEWDGYTVRLYNRRGQDAGVRLAYGKNITDLTQEENIANVVTGVYPYWTGSDGEYTELSEKIVLSDAASAYPYPRIVSLDCSGEFEAQPTETELREYATNYLADAGTPAVSIDVSFVALWQTEEYKDIAPLERVQLGDTVTVDFAKLGVSASSRVVETDYNVLIDRYDSITLGSTRANLSDTITAQQQEIADKPSKTFLEQAIDSATALITGVKGGYVVLNRDANGQPYELLIMDTPDVQTAQNVWRFNQAGWGHSSTGYNGPYTLAATQDGAIVADFITAGTMLANRIKGGTLTLGGAGNGNGVFSLLNAAGSEVVHMNKDGINAIAGILGGWNLTNGAFYKDVTVGQTVYRVYLQPPGQDNPGNTWVLSCQISTDGGNTFYGAFILYANGTAYFSQGGGTVRIGQNGAIVATASNGVNITVDGYGISIKNSDGEEIGAIRSTGANTLGLFDDVEFTRVAGSSVYNGDVYLMGQGDNPIRLTFTRGVCTAYYD